MEHREIFAGASGNFFWSFGKFFVDLAVKFAACYTVGVTAWKIREKDHEKSPKMEERGVSVFKA